MDIISFNEASTANGRIESFIENPDSMSGVVTVPKVIASGETITIPAGRVAILPNVQIDGVLNVENGGEVFIPSGASLSKVVEKVPSTDNAIVRFDGTTGAVQNSTVLIDDNGNLNITGTGKRITGDFSNATLSNRLVFQTSTTNGRTAVGIIPNGTSTTALLRVANSSDLNNYNVVDVVVEGTSARIQTAGLGTNPHTPLEFWVSGNEKMRIDTAGDVLVTGGGGLGYGAGSGGTVTQLTSKSTAVTLNKPTGEIVMNNAALASGTIVEFALYNSILSSSDLVIPVINYSSLYTVNTSTISNGVCSFVVQNRYSTSLSEPLKIKFFVIKGASS